MRRSPLILLAMLLLARPTPGRAGPVSLVVPAEVRAGELVEVRWAGLPDDVREVELEMSLDQGRWVRISPELDDDEGHFRWRVPAVASERTRFRLRAGGKRDQRGEEFEDVVMESGVVSIIGLSPATPLRPAASDEPSDWWNLSHAAPLELPHSLMPGQTELAPTSIAVAIAPSRFGIAGERHMRTRATLSPRADSAPLPLGARAFAAPRTLSLRN